MVKFGFVFLVLSTGYPLHREMARIFGNFAKTQGIWFAQVVNSMILKV